MTARFGYIITRNAIKTIKVSFLSDNDALILGKPKSEHRFIMTDRDTKTIELIINNEQAKKKLEELKVGFEALIVKHRKHS